MDIQTVGSFTPTGGAVSFDFTISQGDNEVTVFVRSEVKWG